MIAGTLRALGAVAQLVCQLCGAALILFGPAALIVLIAVALGAGDRAGP